jgi:hypothetical protein
VMSENSWFFSNDVFASAIHGRTYGEDMRSNLDPSHIWYDPVNLLIAFRIENSISNTICWWQSYLLTTKVWYVIHSIQNLKGKTVMKTKAKCNNKHDPLVRNIDCKIR